MTMEPLTKEWAAGALKAVRETIEGYESNDYSKTCPLCTFVLINGDSCSICPWIVFRKQHCTDADYHSYPIPIRLRRLRGWGKKLVNILERKKNRRRTNHVKRNSL